jgi:PAS domain-containing protein
VPIPSQPTAGSMTTTGVGTLRSLGTPLSVPALLEVGAAVAAALALRHGRSGLHGGVSPDSILIGPDGHVTLLDAPRGTGGRRRYAAPEQSGRLARDVDERADLYALGAVLYELATGRSPVPGSVHAQLTQATTPVVGLPAGLAGVLHWLLAPAPEDRYQTARGVLADLRRCQEDLAAFGDIDAFPAGLADFPGRPTFSGRLFGRAKQLTQLHAARERTAQAGGVELIWTGADPGLGKSALLGAFGDAIVTAGGLVARTTFEATDTAPYQGMSRLLADLAAHLLMDSAAWRVRLADALGGTAPVLGALAPELAPLVEAERGYPAPEGAPAAFLLRLGVRRLLSTVAATEGPLTLLLDDLHFADPATIELLRYVLGDPETTGLLVVGAYRPRELDGRAAELVRDRGPWRTGGLLALRPLPDSALTELLADTLRASPADAAGLARAVAERTGSRPLAVAEFLRQLRERRLLTLDETRGWRWDPVAVAAAPPIREVASAVPARLGRLAPRLLRLLQVAATLGGTATVAALARVTGLTRDGVLDLVRTAVREGLLAAQAGDGRYRWTHEEVRRAVRATLGEAQSRELAAGVGQMLLRHNGPGDPEQVVRLCAETCTDEDDRARVAGRALTASRRAYRLGALDVADERMRTAVGLLTPEAWATRPTLAHEVHLWAARTAWEAGDRSRADGLLDVADRYASDDLSRARVLALRARWHGYRTAVAQALKLLGVPLTRRAPRRVPGAPATDPRAILAQELIADALDPAAPVEDWTARLAATGIRLAVEAGPTPTAALAFAVHAVAMAERAGLRDSAAAVGAARTALTLSAGTPGLAARVAPVVARVRGLWYEPDGYPLTCLDEGYRRGIEAGEPARALDNRVLAIAHRFVLGAPLAGLAEEVEEVRALADRYGLPDPTEPVAGAIARLRGTAAPLGGSVPALVAGHLLGETLPVEVPPLGLLGAVAAIVHGLRGEDDAEELQARLDGWAGHGPATFGAYAALLAAERARLSGEPDRAADRYARAVDTAREHGLVLVEGLAAELGGRYTLGRGQTGPAVAYLRRARDCYQRWRAPELVAHVDRTLAAVPSRPDRTFDQLDLLAMVRAFQAITAELSPDRLVVTLLKLLVEHTHAERGALLVPSGNRLTVAASAQSVNGRISVLAGPAEDTEPPRSVVAYVRRERQAVGGTPDRLPAGLADDPYFAADPPRALLCTPILRDQRLIAVLYLEHRHLSGWFGAEHLDLLDVLCAQAAIALDNAQTHARLVEANQILDATFDRLPIGLILLGPDLTVRRASSRAVEVTGLPIEPGTPLVDLFDVLTPTDVDGLPYRFEPAFARTGGVDRPVYRDVLIVSPTGTRQRIHTAAQPLRDDAGTLIGVTLWVSPLPPDAG